ncbi:hypothetical protein [Microlunatus flavus]|uniref:Uncharacterized protein n=1 Tax=Microlunatus flavus TaxID=1036181 RepID=A0A1H9DC43_9ACTN|nr:hypothetical protein [Microlunatus flavus]SEQ11065.1 hypothetical protein SAMN05421756_102496 [Microlunatus flavus]
MTATAGWVATKAVEPALGSPWPGRELGQVRRTVRHAATVPLALLLGVQWLFVVGRGVPETTALPARDWWLEQLGLVSVLDHPLGAGLLLLCSAALALLVRRSDRVAPVWLVPPTLVGSVVALVLLLAQAVAGLGAGALAVVVLLVWLASAWWAASHAVVAGLAPRRPVTSRTGALLVAVWVLLLPGPLAVGRWLLAGDLRTEAEVLAGNSVGLRFAALLTAASVRLSLFGALLGVVAWLAYQVWPRGGARRRWRWYAALAVGLVALLELWWTAQTVADQRVTQLRYGSPGDELHFTCATWVYPPDTDAPAATPTQTVAVSGSGCATVTAYAGYHQLGTTVAGVSVSPVALRRPAPAGASDDRSAGSSPPTLPLPTGRSGSLGPAGEPRPLAGARYGDVLVLAGSNRFDRTADQVVAVPLHGGPALWRFVCGDKREVRARFAGGRPDPASAATTPGDPGDVVLLTCGARRLRLDPVTGLTAAR